MWFRIIPTYEASVVKGHRGQWNNGLPDGLVLVAVMVMPCSDTVVIMGITCGSPLTSGDSFVEGATTDAVVETAVDAMGMFGLARFVPITELVVAIGRLLLCSAAAAAVGFVETTDEGPGP